jgi:hypothetical protein
MSKKATPVNKTAAVKPAVKPIVKPVADPKPADSNPTVTPERKDMIDSATKSITEPDARMKGPEKKKVRVVVAHSVELNTRIGSPDVEITAYGDNPFLVAVDEATDEISAGDTIDFADQSLKVEGMTASLTGSNGMRTFICKLAAPAPINYSGQAVIARMK